MTPFDPILIAIFGPIGIALGIMAWVGWNVYKLMSKVGAEVSHNDGASIKDMLSDQREYSRTNLTIMREVLSTQREVKDLLRDEHEAASEYRVWAAQRIEGQEDALRKLTNHS